MNSFSDVNGLFLASHEVALERLLECLRLESSSLSRKKMSVDGRGSNYASFFCSGTTGRVECESRCHLWRNYVSPGEFAANSVRRSYADGSNLNNGETGASCKRTRQKSEETLKQKAAREIMTPCFISMGTSSCVITEIWIHFALARRHVSKTLSLIRFNCFFFIRLG